MYADSYYELEDPEISQPEAGEYTLDDKQIPETPQFLRVSRNIIGRTLDTQALNRDNVRQFVYGKTAVRQTSQSLLERHRIDERAATELHRTVTRIT